ncbi:hypothetical protein [Hymenobacter profundi]|uniref:Uncharacterized protein n=1 Tax=Hymenobacter profundi TaxID=1982110 RepID=A0ABS6WV42_9BACT|nr:hypothetical protein [Hymenobacter profundi]MBW3127467.1 hypothetical protein [Hymenobacter profundi]
MKHFTSFYPALLASLVGLALSLSSCQPSTESTTAAGTTEAAAATSTHEQLVADHQQMEADHRTAPWKKPALMQQLGKNVRR